MQDINLLVLTGRLTRDPSVRTVSVGDREVKVARLPLAVNKRIKDKEHTDFVDVTVWDTGAVTAEKVLKKGSRVMIEGSVRVERRKNKDGTDGYPEITVRCNQWTLLGQPLGQKADTDSVDTGESAGFEAEASAPAESPRQTASVPF